VLVAAVRLDPAARLPFAITTARNLAVDAFRATARDRRNQHRLLDLTDAAQPEDEVLAAERSQALSSALDGLEPAEREALVAHSDGVSTADLAERDSTTPGAVAARLARSRARLRVDYVIALRKVQLPTKLCRPAAGSIGQRPAAATRLGHRRPPGWLRGLRGADPAAGTAQQLLGWDRHCAAGAARCSGWARSPGEPAPSSPGQRGGGRRRRHRCLRCPSHSHARAYAKGHAHASSGGLATSS